MSSSLGARQKARRLVALYQAHRNCRGWNDIRAGIIGGLLGLMIPVVPAMKKFYFAIYLKPNLKALTISSGRSSRLILLEPSENSWIVIHNNCNKVAKNSFVYVCIRRICSAQRMRQLSLFLPDCLG